VYTAARLFPSTINNTATLNITATQKSKAAITITDMAGRRLHYSTVLLAAGNNSITMDVSALRTGIYLLAITDDTGTGTVLRFIKQ
jgi:predicted dinucleotide-utilizing enzyme